MSYRDKKILFYDGDCGFCLRSLSLLLRYGRDEALFFAPLQGRTARALLGSSAVQSPTLILWDRGQVSARSTAALELLASMGPFIHLLARLLRLIPRPLRDYGYDLIAKKRHLIASRPNCVLPSPEERRRFLP